MRWLKILFRLLILSAAVIGAFYYFQPAPAPLWTRNFLAPSELNDSNLNTYLTSNPGDHYLFFCSTKVSDCHFVNNNIFRSLTQELNVETLPNLTYVDLSNTTDSAFAKFKRQWGFANYPVWVMIQSTDQNYVVKDVLEWKQQEPLDASDVKQWLMKHNAWLEK
jgi:hypothetical protein